MPSSPQASSTATAAVGTRPRIAVVSNDVAPANGGGIAAYVAALADTLAEWAEVTLFTRASTVRALERVNHEQRSVWTLDPRVALVAVPDDVDGGPGSYFNAAHRHAASVYAAVAAHYDGRGPDLIEVPDYLAEGAVLVQARAAQVPWLRGTRIVVRAHTTHEVVWTLNGALPDDEPQRLLWELERYVLREADACVVGGAEVGALYRRFYDGELAPTVEVRHPVPRVVRQAAPVDETEPGPLRLLYLGRLERRKGVQALVEALRATPADLRLTVLGADTETGPRGVSVRAAVRLAAAGDQRVRLQDPLPPEDVPAFVAGHDAVVVPSTWECWPNVALEALAVGVPVLARPVGGLVEIVGPPDDDGRRPGGWLARDASGQALLERIEQLAADLDAVRDPARRTAARARFEELTRSGAVKAGYRRLLARAPRWDRAEPVAGPASRVTVVIPYFRLPQYVEAAVQSALDQTHPNVTVVVVDDGSTDPGDAVLGCLAERDRVTVLTKAGAGLGAARNTGVRASLGDFVVPLDADNLLGPTFVERCLDVLMRREDLEFVTSWSRYVDEAGQPFRAGPDEGWQPLSNDPAILAERNVAGDAVALLRRRIFDDGFFYDEELTSFEDWFLYLRLRDAGRRGIAIPERLFDYRIRPDSMLRTQGEPAAERLMAEMRARRRELEVEWCPWNA
ncbi:glycosyltransferase [Patulibacter brassicae]|uniref:Glycosyltransferase n=1 Tax=Patulibacter brassicae TaxID=1705717 RepID=A0ABU4VII4_9ACTN|nr:glycosyltransferase [Patulibacter brassicae]MDX8151647.1 glycosyltransferase [Patulibacter brassicae]